MLFQAIPKRLLMLPLDEARFSPITLFDLAEAAKNILLSCTPDTEGAMSFAPEHRGRGYHVTGPEAVDGVELAELLSRFTRGDATEDGGFAGYEVQYVSCSRNEAKRVLVDLCELHAMGGTLGISSEGDRADGLASWTVRSKEVEAFLNLFDHLKSSHERAEEELRTGARIPDDPLHQVETCVTEDLKYLIGREGLGISDLLDKQQLSIVNEVQLSNALSPRSSLSRRQRSESKETLSETSMESSSP
ncbi:hypothetical protein DFJ74DRAFT_310595 [Hyaloraphidium curvatum]|nr:hypothetical protein DFJ74DRAFT_310595 [Hyaloraphidium curvatum]